MSAAASADRRLISVVVPVFNEETAVPLFYERLAHTLSPLRDRYRFELLFSNDGSTDATLERIRALRARDPEVQVLTLSRNFGYEAAITAALHYARGDAVICIDVDCEDPPEMIAQFIAEWETGADVVYGRRDKRPEPLLWRFSRWTFYRLNRLIADSEIVVGMGNFFLITRRVRDAALAHHATKPFLRSDVAYTGFRRKAIPYERHKRIAGETHYSVWGATKFAVAGILSSSTFPLRLAVWTFPLLVLSNLLLRRWHRMDDLLMVDLLYIAFFLVMICIYLARTYKDVVQRATYIVDWATSEYDGPVR